MNTIEHTIVVFAAVLCLLTVSYNTPVYAETTQVCVDVKDKAGQPVKDKSGKVKQNCKTMKKHEKLEGTPVPDKK
jgi:capsular polysaccharide biosynthesis protein